MKFVPPQKSRLLELKEGTYYLDTPILIGKDGSYDRITGKGKGLTKLISVYGKPCIDLDANGAQQFNQDAQKRKSSSHIGCAVTDLSCYNGGIVADGDSVELRSVDIWNAKNGLLLGSKTFLRESVLYNIHCRHCDDGIVIKQTKFDKTNNIDIAFCVVSYAKKNAMILDGSDRSKKNMVSIRSFGGLIHGRSLTSYPDPLVKIKGRVREVSWVGTRFIVGNQASAFQVETDSSGYPERIFVSGNIFGKSHSKLKTGNYSHVIDTTNSSIVGGIK